MSPPKLGIAFALGIVFAGVIGAVAIAAPPPAPSASAKLPPSASPLAADAGTATKVPAEIMVLHATNTDGGIDPSIGSLPQLKRPPFSAYNTYKLIARHAISLSNSQPENTTKLPNGRVLKTSLLAAVPKDRYRIAASISQPSQDAGQHNFLPLLEVTAKSGETFFVAGQSYRGGVLVVGIKVGK